MKPNALNMRPCFRNLNKELFNIKNENINTDILVKTEKECMQTTINTEIGCRFMNKNNLLKQNETQKLN